MEEKGRRKTRGGVDITKHENVNSIVAFLRSLSRSLEVGPAALPPLFLHSYLSSDVHTALQPRKEGREAE